MMNDYFDTLSRGSYKSYNSDNYKKLDEDKEDEGLVSNRESEDILAQVNDYQTKQKK